MAPSSRASPSEAWTPARSPPPTAEAGPREPVRRDWDDRPQGWGSRPGSWPSPPCRGTSAPPPTLGTKLRVSSTRRARTVCTPCTPAHTSPGPVPANSPRHREANTGSPGSLTLRLELDPPPQGGMGALNQQWPPPSFSWSPRRAADLGAVGGRQGRPGAAPQICTLESHAARCSEWGVSAKARFLGFCSFYGRGLQGEVRAEEPGDPVTPAVPACLAFPPLLGLPRAAVNS